MASAKRTNNKKRNPRVSKFTKHAILWGAVAALQVYLGWTLIKVTDGVVPNLAGVAAIGLGAGAVFLIGILAGSPDEQR